MPITLTDAEQSFADSPEGRMRLARARNSHEMREAHKGANARPWTDSMEATATRDLAAQHARGKVIAAANLADFQRQEPILRAQRDAAYAKHKAELSNAWRNGR